MGSVFFNNRVGEWSSRVRAGLVVFCSIAMFGIGYQLFVKEKMRHNTLLLKNAKQLRHAFALRHRQAINVNRLALNSVAPPPVARFNHIKVTPGALSHVSLDALHFVGVFSESSKTLALIKEPGGRIHTVRLGEYLGRNEGRVVRIDSDRVEIEELVHVGKRWSKKRVTLHL